MQLSQEVREYLAKNDGEFRTLLEQHQEQLMVENSQLDRLREVRSRQPHYMDRSAPGRLVADWNLIVPEQVLSRSWEGEI